MEPSSAHIEKSIHFEWDQKPGRPPGTQAVAIPVPPFTRVGMLICADAYTSEIARNLQAQGAQLLVSAAAWAPGHHGPNGEWERCTHDTGLPLIVCNRDRTGRSIFVKPRVSWSKTGCGSCLCLSHGRQCLRLSGIWKNRRWRQWSTGPYTSSRILKKAVLHDHFLLLSQRRNEETELYFLSMGIL
jgi:hypothetical protein